MSATDYGIKVSLPGFDVLTATPEQCALHSSYPAPKIELHHAAFTAQATAVYTFSANPAHPSTTNLVTVSHPYSYAPFATATWFYDFGGGRGPEYGSFPLFLNINDTVYAYATTSQFKLDLVRLNTPTHPDLTGLAFTYRYTITCENGA